MCLLIGCAAIVVLASTHNRQADLPNDDEARGVASLVSMRRRQCDTRNKDAIRRTRVDDLSIRRRLATARLPSIDNRSVRVTNVNARSKRNVRRPTHDDERGTNDDAQPSYPVRYVGQEGLAAGDCRRLYGGRTRLSSPSVPSNARVCAFALSFHF